MEQVHEKANVEVVKPMATIYATLVVSLIILTVFGNIFSVSGLAAGQRVHVAFLIFVGSLLLMILGAEIARMLHRVGMTSIGFIGFLVSNLLLGGIILAVSGDVLDINAQVEFPVLLMTYLLLGAIWYFVIFIMTIVTARREKRTEST